MEFDSGFPPGGDSFLEQRIAAVREREAKASKGPWRVVYNGGTLLSIAADYPKVPARLIAPARESSEEERESSNYDAFRYGGADALNYEFLAHAREDIPFLLAALAEARRERDAAKTVYNAAMAVCEAFADERLFTWLVMKPELCTRLQLLADAVMSAEPKLAGARPTDGGTHER